MNDEITAAYDNVAESYADTYSQPSENLDEFLAMLQSSGTILDAGCGVGRDSKYLLEKAVRS